MTPLIHNYSNLAGQTVYWDTSDSKELYLKNIQNPELRQRLDSLGFLEVPIEYQYNSHGFRTAEFDQQFDVVCFGCSFTMGTGIHAKDNWPSQLQELTGLSVANLAHAGSSNDTTFRFADYYLKLLKPQYAIWLQTDCHRIEIVDDSMPLSLNILASDTHNPCANDHYIKTWFSSDSNHRINLQKNTLAFKYLCHELNIKSIILPRDNTMDRPFPKGNARDLLHPGADTYTTLAQQVKTMLEGLALV